MVSTRREECVRFCDLEERMVGWCGESQKVFTEEDRERGTALVYTEKKLVQGAMIDDVYS